jgi:non-homologous end joining protein Ku
LLPPKVRRDHNERKREEVPVRPGLNKIDTKPEDDAVNLAVDLIKQQSGKFEPQKLSNEYARAVHELVQAKIEQRASCNDRFQTK